MGKLEVLRTELERAKENLHKRGLSYEGKANTADELMKAKPFEIAYQDVIEKIWPDNAWWEVTHYWDIFDAMMGGLSDEEVIDEIIKHVGPDYVDECKEACIRGAHVEKGHNMREYLEKFGDEYDEGKLWDHLKEDFEEGRVDARKDIVYWYMEDLNGEWRYFETSTLNEAKEEKKLDEGTSNFGAGPEHFPLLVFYTYDEFESIIHNNPDYPDEDDFEHEDEVGHYYIDWDALYDARDKFEQEQWDENKVCVLDEDAQERLENKIYEFNEETRRIADNLYDEAEPDDYYALKDIEIVIGNGYYEAQYIDVDNEDQFKYMSEELAKTQIERFTKFFNDIKSEFTLTKLSAGPAASNGERGYSIIDDSLKEEKQHDGKCPFCGSENIDFVDSDEDSEKHVCRDCGQDFLVHDDGHVTTRNNRPIEESHEVEKDFSKSDINAMINWWKKLYDLGKYRVDIGDGKFEDIEGWHAAMFDMLDDLSKEDTEEAKELFKSGKRLYNKYALSKYNEELKENKEVGRIEFCIMDANNNNIECYDDINDAIKFAKENDGARILRVMYGPKNEHGDEPELSAECVWNREEESLEESCSDKELVDKLVAFGTCDSEEEAEKRVAKMSQEMKDEMCKSLKRQAQDHLLNDSYEESLIEEKKSKKKYKIRYTGNPEKDAAFFNHAMGSDKGDVSVEQSSVSLGEGFVGQEVEDFLDVVNDNEAIETLVISNIDADDYTEAFKGKYEDLDSNLLHCEYADFDVGGDILVVNVKTESDDWNDSYYDDLESLLEDYNGDEVKIIDIDTGDTLFEGDKEDIDDEVKGLTFWSIDTPKYLCVNAHCGEVENDDEEEQEDGGLKIEYWYDEESRDQGLGDIYFGEIEDVEDGKRIVRKMIDRDGYASAELQKGDEVIFGYDGESTWGNEKDESLEEASHRGMAYYEYKGCHVRETPSCFVATDEHGTTLGDSKTKAGAEALIDDHVEKKDEKLSKKQIDNNVKRNIKYIKWQNDREHREREKEEKREEALKEGEDLYALHVKVIDADTGKINKIDRLFVGSKKECDAKKKQLEETSPEDSHHNRNIYKVSKVK